MQVKKGSFTGTGALQTITLPGFAPDLVILVNNSSTAGNRKSFKTRSMATDLTASFVGNVANFANGVTLLSEGFSVGTDANCNENIKTIYYIAIKDDGPDFAYGTYTGNGSDNRAITGLGFSPAMVTIKHDGTSRGRWQTPAADAVGDVTLPFDGLAPSSATGQIKSLDADGFTLGTDAAVNQSSAVYHWFAFKAVAGQFATGSYTGNGADNRDISGVTDFTPIDLWIKSNNTDNGAHRCHTIAGDLSWLSWGGAAAADGIQALAATGFQVGTNGVVNGNTKVYYWAAIGEPAVPAGMKTYADEGLVS